MPACSFRSQQLVYTQFHVDMTAVVQWLNSFHLRKVLFYFWMCIFNLSCLTIFIFLSVCSFYGPSCLNEIIRLIDSISVIATYYRSDVRPTECTASKNPRYVCASAYLLVCPLHGENHLFHTL